MLEANPSVFRACLSPDAVGAFGRPSGLRFLASLKEGGGRSCRCESGPCGPPGGSKRMRRPHAHDLLIYRPSVSPKRISPEWTRKPSPFGLTNATAGRSMQATERPDQNKKPIGT